MKKAAFFLLILFSIVFTMYAQTAEAAITASPSSITIARGSQSTRSITHNIIDSTGCTLAASASGQFISGSNILGTVNTSVSASLDINTAIGSAAESLTIPVSVVKKAEQLRVNSFQFQRQFTITGDDCITHTGSGTVQITVTTEAAAEFKITRLQLYFENKRAETTVMRHQPLKAYADISFAGSGLLQGYWEADGRIISNVKTHLIYGKSVTLETPEIPSLPTFQAGTHRLRFVITSPSGVTLPDAIYFVTAEEFRQKFIINLLSPDDKTEIDYSPHAFIFTWKGANQAVAYLVEFLEKGGEKPIFSAYTKNSEYKFPLSVFKSVFSSGGSYFWRVKGFDAENNEAAESNTYSFTIKEQVPPLPSDIK